MTNARTEMARPVFSILAILALVLTSFWILRPFIGASVWATTIVVATWPLLLALQRLLRGRRGWAVAILSLVLLGVLVVPFVLYVAEAAGALVVAAGLEAAAGCIARAADAEVAGVAVIAAVAGGSRCTTVPRHRPA